MHVRLHTGETVRCGAVRKYGATDYRPLDTRAPGDEVHHLVMALRRQHPAMSYKQSLNQVLSDPANAELKRAFAGEVRRDE